MADQPIRIGIIGTGQIAQHHLKVYSQLPGAKVAAVCDIVPEKVNKSAQTFGVEHIYSDFRELLKRDDIDAVDVCLHNNLHAPAVIAGLEAGKHVYCEKPIAGSYRDGVSMIETARRVGKKLHIQLSTLYQPETRAARELIAAGEIGEIYHARSTGHRRRGRPYVDGYGAIEFVQKPISGGGALYDMGVYHISQLLYLMGNPEVKRISGKTYQKIDIDEPRRARSNYSVEELGVGFVRFAGDLTLDIIEAWAIHLDKLESSCLLGSKGGIRLSPFSFFRTVGDLVFDGAGDMTAAGHRWNNVRGDGHLYANSQAHWIAHLQGKTELLPTSALALNTMLISEGIYLSEKLDREVTADEIKENSVSTALKI